jgi:hypothetical protein
MRAILIDPERRAIEEIDVPIDPEGRAPEEIVLSIYEPIKKVLGGPVDTATWLNQMWDGSYDVVYVLDSDHWRETPRFWFQLDIDPANRDDPPMSLPLGGKGLVLRVDERGREGAPAISVEALTKRVRFTERSRWDIRSAWVCGLSNAALLDELDVMLEIEPRDSGVARRLEILHDEICRRERGGSLTEDDWRLSTERN